MPLAVLLFGCMT